jgi:hypothetical protein
MRKEATLFPNAVLSRKNRVYETGAMTTETSFPECRFKAALARETRQEYFYEFWQECRRTKENLRESGGTERKPSGGVAVAPKNRVYNSPVRATRTNINNQVWSSGFSRPCPSCAFVWFADGTCLYLHQVVPTCINLRLKKCGGDRNWTPTRSRPLLNLPPNHASNTMRHRL